MFRINFIIFIFLLLVKPNCFFSQNTSPLNLPKYDVVPLHFGMSLGLNAMDFTIRNSGQFWYLDSVYSVENIPKVGININIVSNYNFHKYFSLRFLPGLNLGQRNLEYWVRADTIFYAHTMKIESTFLDFPLLLQYKAERINNFRPYLIAGGSIKVDLASQKRIRDEELPKIRLKRMSYYYELGVGSDFFLEYFKFALELKYAVGLNNVIVPDGSQYTRAIHRMTSKMLMLSFTFEGSDIRVFKVFSRKK
ncbi:MAG: PorT family protein [Bacteroidales bacterium]|nr:PorT family protein [Bacteroidales bacterium]